MMKILHPTQNFVNFKCGEIYCLSNSSYSVSCCLCGEKIVFEQFPQHFERNHLFQQSEGETIIIEVDPIKSEEPESTQEQLEEFTATQDEDEKLIDLDTIQSAVEIETADDLLQSEQTLKAFIVQRQTEAIDLPVADNDWAQSDANSAAVYTSDEKHSSTSVTANKTKRSKVEVKKSYACSHCERKYKSRRTLTQHLRTHNPTKQRATSKPKLKCNECGKLCRNDKTLKAHSWSHTGIVCDICGKSFSQVGNMLRHKIRHTGIKAHKCTQCDHTFFTQKELNAHMLRHTGIFPHVCEICGKRCRDRGVLTAHMRRHTGERPAKCNVCGKSFYCNYDLNVHSVTHSSERPFECNICKATFQLKKALRVHKKVHSKDSRNHICKICGKAFAQESGLVAHSRTHDAAATNNTTINVK